MFYDFIPDEDVRLIGVEAAGAASLGTGRPGVLHGARSSLLADDDGQIMDAHSISAGLDYPGVGPEHAHLRDTGRAEYVPCTDDEALAAFHRLCETEGIVPALESSHALARALDCGAELDRRLPLRPRRQGSRRGAGAMEQDARRLPDGDARHAAARAGGGRGGRRRVELGFPFSDPLADGPVIRRAGERALAAGMRTRALPRGARRDARARRRAARADDVRLDLRRLRLGAARAATRAQAGATSLIVVDLPADVRPELRRVQLVAPTSTDERLRLAAVVDRRLALPRHGHRHDRRARRARPQPRAARRPGACGHRRAALRRLRHLDPEHARAAAELVDGIVVGSAAVNAAEAGESELAALVGSLRAALDESK